MSALLQAAEMSISCQWSSMHRGMTPRQAFQTVCAHMVYSQSMQRCQDLSACCRQVREILARMHQAEEQHSKRGVLERLALADALNQKAGQEC